MSGSTHPAPSGCAEDFSHHVEVTDAQADQLLAEYEQEQRQKPQKTSSSSVSAAPGTGTTAGPDTTTAAGEERPGSRSPGRGE